MQISQSDLDNAQVLYTRDVVDLAAVIRDFGLTMRKPPFDEDNWAIFYDANGNVFRMDLTGSQVQKIKTRDRRDGTKKTPSRRRGRDNKI